MNCAHRNNGVCGAELEDFRRAFKFFDANNDGYITLDELESAMNKCGQHPSKLELRHIMTQGDRDQNGVITFDEFTALMRDNECRSKYSHHQLREQFQMFDKDNDGYIERSEMTGIVRELSLGRFFPNHVIDQLFREADVDGDGRISFEEFVMAVN
uniref:Calmodulin n=1 Tax=Steinernema glaseri TaxID=37863 RepID=A0A1I7YVS4_9BILA